MNWTPVITTEGYYGTSTIDLEAKHLTNGKIFLNGEITSETANNFVKAHPSYHIHRLSYCKHDIDGFPERI